MYIYKNNDAISWDRCVATVGFFDGVHGGHRFLLNEVVKEARDRQMIAVVITFNEHPRKVLKSDFQPRLLTTLEEKLELIVSTGIDACVVLDFTTEFSKMSAKEFFSTVLRDKLHVETLFVGYDHRFGYNREDGYPEYSKYGNELNIKVIQSKQYTVESGEHFSSSQIRNALSDGDIMLANTVLTYPYTFIGKVIGGYKNGRKIGFPTANIWFDSKEKIIPAVGVYAVYVYIKGKRYKGMMNIGYRPTFSSDEPLSLEVHILDFESDIYDQKIKIECICRIRDEMKFNGIEELIEQLKKDKETVNNLL
ncbi:MAG: bifunctional riboflavin kinase/FAD synthetase [Paludibacteraceae bacterium]